MLNNITIYGLTYPAQILQGFLF